MAGDGIIKLPLKNLVSLKIFVRKEDVRKYYLNEDIRD